MLIVTTVPLRGLINKNEKEQDENLFSEGVKALQHRWGKRVHL